MAWTQPTFDTTLRDIYFAPPPPNEAYWRQKLANQGSLKKPDKSVRKVVHDTIERAISKVASERTAARIANKATQALDDLTPVGNVTMAEDGAHAVSRGVRRGSLLEALMGTGQVALAAIPAGPKVREALDALKGIRAWHGSPHSFDKFDISRVGTGEGAQAYGHGLYFAENKAVADEYRRNLTTTTGPSVSAAQAQANHLLSMYKTPESALGAIHDSPGLTPEALAFNNDVRAALLSGYGTKGHLYEVNINAKPDDFLDWDRPAPDVVSRIQGDPVVDAWKENGALPHITGQNLYRHMADGLTRGAAERGAHVKASQQLLDYGIPGIRYFDQGSRGAGEGTRNYVVFDPGLIEILNKY